MAISTTRWIPRDGIKPLRMAVINRGESAVRFMRTARVWSRRHDRPIELIAFYTEPDAKAPFVQMADRAIYLGDPFMVDAEGVRKSSYLDVEGLVALCKENDVDTVWPGWGFLGESPELSEACKREGITFIGPDADVMRLLGDKVRSKAFAEEHNVPVSPWSGKAISDPEEALQAAERIGFPLILKAAAGGGGRGIRLVREPGEIESAFRTATAEALAAFGDGAVFIEKFVESARHVEVQILADRHGTVWSLGTRDCSVQRRHQKVLEETPAPALDPAVEDAICASARRMAKACGYLGAGTAEFLLLPDKKTFYFLEMNARLQVEHTISECVFGVDLVDAQIDVALGQHLPEEAPQRRGAAIEARLNAEEPDMGFAPAGGLIRTFDFPGGPGIRVDAGFRAGDSISGAFDSNIAKIIAQGRDRAEALARLEQALRDTRVVIEGGLTNRAMILEILTEDDFINVTHTTKWLDTYLGRRPQSVERPFLAQSMIAAALFDFTNQRAAERQDLFANVHAGKPQRLNPPQPVTYKYLVDGNPLAITVGELEPDRLQVHCDDFETICIVEDITEGSVTFVAGDKRYTALAAQGAGWIQINTHDVSHRFERIPDGCIMSDMAAVITQVCVEPGQIVHRGDRLLTLEVMKMEIHLDAPMTGMVDQIHVTSSVQVGPGEPLLDLAPVSEATDEADPIEDIHIEFEGEQKQASHAQIIRAGILGYDVTEQQLKTSLDALAKDSTILSMDALLDVMEALIIQHDLFLEAPYDDGLNDARESSAAQTMWFLLHRRFDSSRLSAVVEARLHTLCALHQVDVDHPVQLEDALFRLLQTHLRDAKRQHAFSVFLDDMLSMWESGEMTQEHIERAIPQLDRLVEISTQKGTHELTLRAQHIAHRLRGFADPASVENVEETAEGQESDTPLLDLALEHTATLREFEIKPLPRVVNHHARCALAVAHEDETDRRILAVGALTKFEPTQQDDGSWHCPHVHALLRESIDELRQTLLDHRHEGPWHWNRITLFVAPELTVDAKQMMNVFNSLDTKEMTSLELENLVIVHPPRSNNDGWKIELTPSHAWNGKTTIQLSAIDNAVIQNLSKDDQRIIKARRRRQLTPEQLVSLMSSTTEAGVTGQGTFIEYDLDADYNRVKVGQGRHPGERSANLMIGVMNHPHARFDKGLERVVIVGDLTRTMGSLSEPECRRVNAAIELAEEKGLPVEWISFSSGAKISFDSGTENLDWTARTLRKIIEFTENGGTIHVLVDGACVGAQSYWNAEATMLSHCKGALFMTPRGYMILTGKRALEHSGCVSGSSNEAIGGLPIMAPNGEAQYIAPNLAEAYNMLLRHYEVTYIEPGNVYTKKVQTKDPIDRDVTKQPYTGQIGDFKKIGEIFSNDTNPGRKKAFDIRTVMTTVLDQDIKPLERWSEVEGGESAVVFHGQLGGQPVCMIGIESMQVQRKGLSPTHGPSSWTSGTLYPESSRKVSRAINAASGVKPVVVLANLSGFDGSPESLRNRQLEFGAEIGRSVVNFDGPIIFCVISRYHGGAYVVFSQGLNERLESYALEGTYASVIGGGPAAAVVFPRMVKKRVEKDQRIIDAKQKLGLGQLTELDFERVHRAVHAEMQSQVAKEFDEIHTVQRARDVGSLSGIMDPTKLRPFLCERTHQAVESFLSTQK